MTSAPLQPTLWRTCRVLANRTRLEMLAVLLETPGQTVSAIAAHFKITLSMASQSLRALEARSLLIVRRVGRRVSYRHAPSAGESIASRLGAAVRMALQRDPEAIETIFKQVTAFTHPRRIEIFRHLCQRPHTLSQLQAVTRISEPALARHLRKLTMRGFVTPQHGLYAVGTPGNALGRELARLAASSD
jgi:DNA-binding transcriptional ArsR family regulator